MYNVEQEDIHYVDEYDINSETLSMQPNRDIEYVTIVKEENTTYLVKKTPRQLLEAACLLNGSSYLGRIEYIRKLLGLRNKVPVLISERQSIIAGPTHSPTHPDCVWFFASHVLTSRSCKKHGKNGTLITFRDHSSLFVDISVSQFTSALNKARICQGMLNHLS
ncbi:competence protein ComK [Alkalicoccobacillus murimartini]|uniref:Competence protein ComK n=1 Tax=Alkalicoccobacillus murimartini TaxID=171685 RepID=A0ABT9YGK8_9BACI|nr:competence protein ComK [Alkalicoccobacillus murimartini]MDQ0207004.1 competence protein ComK [Alkalicoccobacillus murimartini]